MKTGRKGERREEETGSLGKIRVDSGASEDCDGKASKEQEWAWRGTSDGAANLEGDSGGMLPYLTHTSSRNPSS